MDYSTIMNSVIHYGSIVMGVMAALVFATTVIVEVVKSLFPKVPTNFVAVTVALSISVLALLVLCAVESIPVTWYYVAGAVILGLFVGYAAMFGFDKFKEAWEKLKKYKESPN